MALFSEEVRNKMSDWTRITYRDFYDVPRMFIIRHRGMQLLFDSEFDDSIDDYSDTYKVYVLPGLSDDELRGSWEHLSDKSTQFLGVLTVIEVVFDSSVRGEVETKIINDFLDQTHITMGPYSLCRIEEITNDG